MKKRDMVLILVLVLVSAVFIIMTGFGSQGGYAYIYSDGRLYGCFDLSEDTEIQIKSDNGIVNDIAISDGSIYMKNATCPGKQCMACGHISRDNETICCAPAKLLIIVRSEEESVYDAITK